MKRNIVSGQEFLDVDYVLKKLQEKEDNGETLTVYILKEFILPSAAKELKRLGVTVESTIRNGLKYYSFSL